MASMLDAVKRCAFAVLSERNGDLDARVVFVGESPGRLGADRTRVPLCGDRAGRNSERLLHAAGLRRGDVFVDEGDELPRIRVETVEDYAKFRSPSITLASAVGYNARELD